MKRFLYTIVICGCLLAGGCTVVGDLLWRDNVYFKSFIYRYDDIDYSKQPQVQKASWKTVRVELPSTIYARQNVWGYEDVEWQESHTKHQELSQRNGDVNFDTWAYDSDDAFVDICLCHTVWNTDNPFSAITIVSDADFDDEHPAGTPLDDLVDIKYYTYRLYIENGYKHTDERAMTSNDYSGDWVTKRLSDWTLEDFMFMDTELFLLTVTTNPTIEQQHHLTVTIDIDGKDPYTFEFDLDFGGISDL